MINRKILFIFSMIFLMAVSSVYAEDDNVKITVNNRTFDVELENNSATAELVKKLSESNITIDAKDYGNFEKVGDLGFSLPTSDESIETSPGDIVLYQSNQISLFYESHSWDYTKIGKIKNATAEELAEVLGSGDVEIVLSLK
ncbi:MAG: hypothetical protein IJQ68_01245 [Methanobrevibacter sp.]|uniref:cyclophilin-like fold protein n=1 Tax=Methanobrevibacter sp. TaxID=66852 RepID=UPI0025DF78FC|nr:cyclophilin-like fold protein [Methanobrevibacter sp.]MBR0270611.1 hypothetical protein [Methanobrevibacter sp.]